MRAVLVMSMLAAALAATADADAKPLPRGMKVFVKDQRLLVSQQGITVPMVDDDQQAAEMFDHVKGATLSDDGATILVAVDSCAGGSDGEPTEVSLASVEARFENVLGMRAHLEKKYDDAIAHFTIAAQKDADHPVYATNLLSAQSLAKKLDDAARTLASYGAKHPGWFAWRLAVDPELANVVGLPAAKPFVAKPSKLAYQALGDDVAVSPIGLVAVSEFSFFGGPGAPGGEDLAIYEPGSATPVVRLPVIALDDACGGDPEMGEVAPCTKPQLARTAAHRRAADRVLAALGFGKQPTAWVDPDDGQARYASPDKATTVELTDDKARITRGKTTVTADAPSDAKRIGFARDVVVFKYRQNGFMSCSGDAQRSYSLAIRVTP
jgi:hypothetical protein